MSCPTPARARAARLGSLVLLAAAVTWPAAQPAAAADPAHCAQPAGATYEWVGGTPGAWNDETRWTLNDAPAPEAPGYLDTDALVCIPSGAEVTLVHNDLAPRGEAIIRTLDLAPGARLIIGENGRLYTSGTGDDRSIVRRGAGGTPAVLELGGTLGGIGTVLVDGSMEFVHLAGEAAPAMTTRHCITFPNLDCHPDAPPSTEPVTSPGRTVVGRRGVLRVTGANGVNLDDARVIDVRGRMEIVGPGYVAADDGTAITIREGARLTLRGEGGIFQGSFSFDEPRALVTLAGNVVRSGPAATSLVDARVDVTDTARARVTSGWLSLGGQVAPTGRVRYGASYGIGRCNNPGGTCATPVASDTDRQTVSVSLPGGRAGSVPVTLVEGDQVAVPPPVRIHVKNVDATAARPMRFRFRIDTTLVDGRPPASFDVRRRADGAATYKTVPDCRPTGRPPAGWRACVASRASAAGGDVVVVVRTQVSSRWKIR